jgi:chemotaxis protein MotA
MTDAQALATTMRAQAAPKFGRRIDAGIFGGIVIAFLAIAAGIRITHMQLDYFVQPSSLLIVFGGTAGVMFITTPLRALLSSARRVADLVWERPVDRAGLVEEIVSLVRTARSQGLLGIEPMIATASHPLLKESLRLALDVERRELQAAVETKLRLNERRGESDAKALEVAGGFAPTIGVIGTVIGLVNVLRQFSDIPSVAMGVGTAFASTLYGLGLANLFLLPLAHRIRASVAERFETEELILEGTLCILDGVHPSLVPDRLNAFLQKGVS